MVHMKCNDCIHFDEKQKNNFLWEVHCGIARRTRILQCSYQRVDQSERKWLFDHDGSGYFAYQWVHWREVDGFGIWRLVQDLNLWSSWGTSWYCWCQKFVHQLDACHGRASYYVGQLFFIEYRWPSEAWVTQEIFEVNYPK